MNPDGERETEDYTSFLRKAMENIRIPPIIKDKIESEVTGIILNGQKK